MRNDVCRTWAALFGIVVVGTVFCGSATAADTKPASQLLSGEEVHTLVDAGQYRDALRALAKILQLNGVAAAPYDRHDMLMLKAECLLQTHDSQGALSTLFLAQKESTAAHQPNEVLMAAAFAELIQKSPGMLYTPKSSATKTPIKILDRTTRKTAYETLFADDMGVFQTKAAAAEEAKNLALYMEAAKAAKAMRAAEFAATGSNEQSAAAIKTLADGALKLVNRFLVELGTRETQISKAANRLVTQMSTVGGIPQMTTRPQGLSPGDPQALGQIMDSCTQMSAAILQLMQALGVDEDSFRSAGSKSEDIKSEAKLTLTANYSGISSVPRQ